MVTHTNALEKNDDNTEHFGSFLSDRRILLSSVAKCTSAAAFDEQTEATLT